mmetsp:Transcript_73461/g.192656  ORF Transcript_73461/g.192656 Transcript_73461/m.192656 type:complete len:320 (-) Transcript_73461:454-1413(-)
MTAQKEAADVWGARRGAPGEVVGCCGLGLGRRERPFEQTLVVVRHSERLDFADPGYPETEEGRAWPFDAPLTEHGVELAQSVAAEMDELHKKARFGMIASSPYRRCMQTAAVIARRLNLPVVLDQEIGEVWGEDMPSERPPHRSPLQLQEMAQELGIQVSNPVLAEGGFKLFGKRPQTWPETVRMGHERALVRMHAYIEQSARHRQNYIIVSHAPAVAAMVNIFQRGAIDIERLEYCARVTASRCVVPAKVAEDSDVYVDQWTVTSEGVGFELNFDASEQAHMEACEGTHKQVAQRREKRTKTDGLFDDTTRKLSGAAA